MFTTKHYINNISLIAFAFTNSLLVLILSDEFRLTAFLLFLGYLIIFPSLSLVSREGIFIKSRIIIPLIFVLLFGFFAVLFLRYDASGIMPALAFVFYSMYLVKDSVNNLEMIIRMFMLLSAPVLILEIIFNGTYVPAVLLMIVITYLQNKNNESGCRAIIYYLSAILAGGIVIVSPSLIVLSMFFLLYAFRKDLWQMLIFFLVSAISFLFVSWFVSDGMAAVYLVHYFSVSLLFSMPWWALIFYGLILIYIGWITADMQEVYFTSALFIALPVIVMLISNLFQSGIAGLRSQNYLTELQVAVPLFITAIKDYKIGKFTGKIMPVDPSAAYK
jgi:hypothetical protein